MNDVLIKIQTEQQKNIKSITISFFVIFIFFACFFIYYHPNHTDYTAIIRNVILAYIYIAVIYFAVIPLTIKNASFIFFMAVFGICTVLMTIVYYFLFDMDIIHYPYSFFLHKSSVLPNFKIALFTCISICFFYLSRTLFLYFNTYQLSVERYAQLTNSFEKEINMLCLQANPYFLYKSLNQLNQIIVKDDFPKAQQYTAEISLLLNKQIEYSTMEQIYLEDELNWVSHYLEMEQLFWDNQFKYSIEVIDDDTYIQKIPPLLLQPLVESFLSQKKTTTGLNYIQIKVGSMDDGVFISIKNEADASSASYKKPIILINMERRIQLINQLHKFHISLESDVSANEIQYHLTIKDLTI